MKSFVCFVLFVAVVFVPFVADAQGKKVYISVDLEGISGVNAAMVYGTDGAIAALDLVVMTDSKGAQIVYEPAPVIRKAVLDKYPGITAPLAKVFGSLSLNALQSLNAKIAVEGRTPRDVAQRYLTESGLLR